MTKESHASRQEARLPAILPPIVVGLVVLPLAWFILGPPESLVFFRADRLSSTNALYLHGLVEWTAACAALMTSFLAFVHFGATRSNPTMAVLAPVFLFAGILDALHALASLDLLPTSAAAATLIPFTWTIGRFYVAIGLAVSPALLLQGRMAKGASGQALLNVGLGVASLGAMYLASRLPDLPYSVFPTGVVRRPTDLGALAIFAIAAVYTLPRFYERYPSLLAHTLMFSMVPQVAAQTFMTFGSAKLYDSAFFFAHGMKLFAYVLPLGGIALDYVYGQRSEEEALLQAERSRLILIEQVKDLTAQHEARHNAEAALLKQVARANLHTRIAVAANQARSLGESLPAVMREICDYTDWIAGHVVLVEPGPPSRLVTTDCWYAENPALLRALQLEAAPDVLADGGSAPDRASSSGMPVWQPLTGAPRSRSHDSMAPSANSVIAVPAMVGSRVVGVLEFLSLDAGAPGQELMETMSHVGVQLGRAFERLPWRAAASLESA